MSIPGSAEPLLLAQQDTGGYQIQRSLRFNSADSAYLSRTPASAGNRKTWTWAGWVKRSKLGATGGLFGAVISPGLSGNWGEFVFNSSDGLGFQSYNASGYNWYWRTNAVFRDVSAWYHVMIVCNQAETSVSNAIKFYVNGVLATHAETPSTWVTNQDVQINSTNTHNIGKFDWTAEYFSGYLADIHFIDGQALDPTSFTETDATTGQLIPKAYTGTYGTNGFHLPFSDNSTAAALGTDTSGNGNAWTTHNLQVVTGGPTSVAAASGALPILNTTGTYGTAVDTGVRADSNASSLVLAVPLSTSSGLDLTDQSPTGRTSSTKTLTNTGVTNSTTNQKFYGGGGAEFDSGNGDYLTIGSNSDFAFGTGNFTIEFWAYPNVSRSDHIVFATNFSNNTGLLVALDTSTNYRPFVYLGGWYYGASNTLKLNSWNHVAVVRSSGTLYFYVNGVRDSGQAFTATNDASNVQIGRNPTFGAESFNGFLQDLRVYKGAAKYTSNFNPPSSTQNATIAAGNDSLVDTPTSYGTDTGAGGEVRGNYCVWNPLVPSATLSNGNLYAVSNGTQSGACGTIEYQGGKYYYEIVFDSGASVHAGIIKTNPTPAMLATTENTDGIIYRGDGKIYRNTGSGWTQIQTPASIVAGDVVGVAVDTAAATVQFYKNGATLGTAVSLTSGVNYLPYLTYGSTGGASNTNFGQRPFAYTAPSGFKALCDTNLPAPVVAQPSSSAFNVLTYTGNGATSTAGTVARTLTGLGFAPDLMWIKERSATGTWADHNLSDSVRGTGLALRSNTTDSETNVATAFQQGGIGGSASDGFTIISGTAGGTNNVNNNNSTYVAWCWDAGSSTVTNTQGSITSSVRANASAGFSIVTYTGNGVTSTVGHGLGVKPGLIILKTRSVANRDWYVYHSSLGATQGLSINTTGAAVTASYFWNNTEPTSAVFTADATYSNSNQNGATYVAYCFAPVAGYSSFGKFTGNSSADGPFIYTGFRPRWIMLKALYNYDGGGTSVNSTSWYIYDSARGTYNGNGYILSANKSYAEENNATDIDFLSNGFKIRNTRTINAAETVYAAFAESPFQYARAR